jgi:hypothetical protein
LREPFGYMTPELYASLSDRVILGCYLSQRDEDGALIPERRRRREQSERSRSSRGHGQSGEPTGRPEDAARELPSAESLEIPALVWDSGTPGDFTLMWWQTWRSRACYTTEQLLERWHQEQGGVKSNG